MKSFLVIIFAALLVVSAAGQSIRTDFELSGFGVNIKTDKRLITVRTTLELAGIQTVLTEDGEKFRKRVLNDFSDFDPVLKNKLKVFVDRYRSRHQDDSPAEIASPFVSMAYSLSDAPMLAEPERSTDLPDSVLEVLDYSPLVREFYSNPGVSSKIEAYAEEFKAQKDFMEPSAREMVRDLLDYLHTRPQLSYLERIKIESEDSKLAKYETIEHRRSFTIVPDLFQAKGNINFLNIGDDYIAIVPPKTDLSLSEVRRAFLQFVLDPLVTREAREIRLKSTGIRSLYSSVRKKNSGLSADPVLVVARSLVAAADIREEQYRRVQLATDQARRKIALMKTDEARRSVASELEKVKAELSDEAVLRLSESYERGAVFAFYFAEKLVGVEQSGFDISGSVLDWMIKLDPKAEEKRLEENLVASQRAIKTREKRKTQKVTTLVENPLTKALYEVDAILTEKKFEEADSRLKALLSEYKENKIETARIYYSLGRSKSIEAETLADPEDVSVMLVSASNYYKRVLANASPSDRALISSTYFALGRIYEHFNQDDYAMQIYDAALRIGNVQGGAFEQAFDAKKSLLAKAQPKK
ncbi:MAG: hypothetical protein HKN25_03545 [Pyrinomonadaceae bacterium]|nr:hypothetical protein [Pyrinomonadaceae bacterium]